MENQRSTENETATAYELPSDINASGNSNDKDADQERSAALRADLDARWKAKMQSRSEDAQARLQHKKQTEAPDENVNEFSEKFKLDKNALLKRVEVASQSAQDGQLSRQQLEAELTEAALQAQSLQEQVSNAAMFLPSYDLRQCSAEIVKINASIEQAREKGAPRRKFTFSQKAKERAAKKAAENKLAAAEAAEVQRRVRESNEAENSKNDTSDEVIADLGPSEIVIDENSEYAQGGGAIVLPPTALQSSQFVRFTGLQNRSIYVCCTVGAVRLVDVRACTVVCGPINGPCFIENCHDSKVFAVSRQMRVHDTTNTDFYIGTMSRPIIEHCSGLRFAPYSVEWEGLSTQVREASLTKALQTDTWSQVDDFRWLRVQQSPNWKVLCTEERIQELVVPTRNKTSTSAGDSSAEDGVEADEDARVAALGVRLLMSKLTIE